MMKCDYNLQMDKSNLVYKFSTRKNNTPKGILILLLKYY